MSGSEYGDRRTMFNNRFSPSIMWLSQTELGSLHLVEDGFTCRTILPAPGLLDFRYFTIKCFLKSCYSTRSFYSIESISFMTQF